ncbi:alpha/beta fold hydrolase [Winogradskyella sp.]|uniref:alpha/beta hydrolase family protein n=1 Tax=Winogradskyella sp. TaxID=1883156 RepID=UPI0026122DE1|nr:alpha/beta fold hydrolase [Winogradskyella sp.]
MKTISKFCIVFLIITSCIFQNKTDGLEGRYEGIFKHKNFETDLGFEVMKDSLGYNVFFTSLRQNAFRIPCRQVNFSNDTLLFKLQSDFHTYSFSNSIDRHYSTLQGMLTIESKEYPYTLKKVNKKDEPTTEEVQFQSNGNTLAGAIWKSTISNNLGLFMVTSSGTNDRNSSNAEALYFSKRGFTVFHFDKRGTGKSTGSLEGITIDDLADDDINAIRYFSKKAGLPLSMITIMGSSQGGAKVPLICNELPELQSGISISTPGCSLLESDLNFMMNRLKNEINKDEFLIAENVQRAVFRYLSGELTKTQLENILNKHKSKQFYQYLWIPELNDEIYQELSYTPIPYFEKLKCPILIIQGLKDIVIPEDSHINIENALIKAGNTNYAIVTLQNANHSMTKTEGTDFPYWSILHPEYLISIEDWIKTVSNKMHK